MANTEGTWLTIFEYSRLKNTSISTIRRRIKANNLKFRLNNGKYEIFALVDRSKDKVEENNQLAQLQIQNEELKKKVIALTEKLNEFEMLMAIYEKRPVINKANESFLS